MTESNKTVAVVGASRNRAKYGNKAVRAYLAEGWTVIPVNPEGGEIEGLPVVPTLSGIDSIDRPIDRITIYLPPPVTLELLPELAAAEAGEVWFNPGTANADVLAAARELDLPVRAACSIVAIGRSPAEFP